MPKAKRMTFSEFIAAGSWNGPASDFSEDWLGDADRRAERFAPSGDPTSWARLDGFLRERGACPEAIEAAHEVWRAFKSRPA